MFTIEFAAIFSLQEDPTEIRADPLSPTEICAPLINGDPDFPLSYPRAPVYKTSPLALVIRPIVAEVDKGPEVNKGADTQEQPLNSLPAALAPDTILKFTATKALNKYFILPQPNLYNLYLMIICTATRVKRINRFLSILSIA